MSANPKRNQPNETFVENRSRSRKVLLSILLLGAFLFLFFLPTIVVNTPLKDRVVTTLTSEIEGAVEIGNISAGWFSPIELSDVHLKSNENQEIVSVAAVRTSSSLFDLLTSGEVEKVTIVEPTLDVLVRPDGSNLEDLFAGYLQPETNQDNATTIPEMQIEIVNANARIRSTIVPQTCAFENLNAKIKLSAEQSPMSGELQFQCSTEDSVTGSCSVQMTADPESDQLSFNRIVASVHADQLPLETLAPMLTRVVGPTNCGGILQVDTELDIDTQRGYVDARIEKLKGKDIALVAPSYLGNDRFVTRSLDAIGQVSISPTSAKAAQFRVETEFAQFSADGDFDFLQLAKLGSDAEVPSNQFQLDGMVDLAQVVSMLPETTHIRDGVAMKTGKLTVTAATRLENGAPRLVVNAETANVNFSLGSKDIVWNQPLRTVAVAGSQNGQFVLHEVNVKSDFLEVAGSAALDHGRLRLSGDLMKVAEQLGQVLDLGQLQLAGVANGELVWNVKPDVQSTDTTLPLDLYGKFQVTNPYMQIPGAKPWRESSIDVELRGIGSANPMTGVLGVDKGQVNLQVGEEKLVASLALPISNTVTDWKYQFDCQATGSIAKWVGQVKNFVELPEFAVDGQLESRFLLTMNSQTFRLNQFQFQASNFVFDGFNLSIRDPRVSGRANLKYQYDDSSLLFTKSKITSPTISLSTDHFLLKTASRILADGAVVFRGNANRISQWIGFSMPGDSVRWDGIANGTMTFTSESNQFGGNLSTKVKDLVFVQPTALPPDPRNMRQVSQQRNYVPFWNEPDIRLTSKVFLSNDFNKLRIRNATIKSKAAEIQLSGTINKLMTVMAADLGGRWNVHWDQITHELKRSLGDVLIIKGQGWQPLRIKGNLYDPTNSYVWIPNQLGGEASLQWNQATLYGMRLGKSNIAVSLNQSIASLRSTNKANIVDQVFQTQPMIDLRQDDPVVFLQQGKLLDQWSVSVQDSRSWLKYAAPLIADATAAEGTLSANLEGAAIPMFDPMSAAAKGELEINSLKIGPGPLARQLISLTDQVLSILKPENSQIAQQSTWLTLKPQKLPFVIQDGRVFHDGFEVRYKDFVVRTRGSVGFDQTLDMVAEIPLTGKWIEADKVLSRLTGKTISVPISGTLSKPKLDQQTFRQATRELLRETAVGAVNERLDREVGELQQKVGNRVQSELNQFQNKLNNKIKNQFEDKVQGEFKNGLEKLFGGDKK